jgi:hypothetical protein
VAEGAPSDDAPTSDDVFESVRLRLRAPPPPLCYVSLRTPVYNSWLHNAAHTGWGLTGPIPTEIGQLTLLVDYMYALLRTPWRRVCRAMMHRHLMAR